MVTPWKLDGGWAALALHSCSPCPSDSVEQALPELQRFSENVKRLKRFTLERHRPADLERLAVRPKSLINVEYSFDSFVGVFVGYFNMFRGGRHDATDSVHTTRPLHRNTQFGERVDRQTQVRSGHVSFFNGHVRMRPVHQVPYRQADIKGMVATADVVLAILKRIEFSYGLCQEIRRFGYAKTLTTSVRKWNIARYIAFNHGHLQAVAPGEILA